MINDYLFYSVPKSKEIGYVICENNKLNLNSLTFSYSKFVDKYFYSFSKGLSIYGPELCHIINCINKYLRTADIFKEFVEMAFPRFLTTQIVENFELTKLWPYYLFKVSSLNSSNYSPTLKGEEQLILDPVQCPWFYEIIKNNYDKINFPFKVSETLGGWSFRNESSDNIIPIEKDITFLRTEFVFAGDISEVINIRVQLICNLLKLLEEIKIPWRVVIGNGCYDCMPEYFSDQLTNSEYYSDVPVLDIEVYLPYKKKWLEIAGASYFGTRKVDRFIKNSNGIQSGCLGIGLSRLALAFLANNNLDEYLWPEAFKK